MVCAGVNVCALDGLSPSLGSQREGGACALLTSWIWF